MTMLAGYFDDSADERAERYFSMAGWFGRCAAWLVFSGRWFDTLDRVQVGEFKAADCESGSGAFHDWPKERRIALHRELVGHLVEAKELVAISARLNIRDLVEYYPRDPDRIRRRAHFYCAQECLIPAYRLGRDLPDGERIAVFFDKGSKIRQGLARLTDWLESPETFESAHRVGVVTTVQSHEVAGVQAADLLAYEIRLEAEGKKREALLDLWPCVVSHQDLTLDNLIGLDDERTRTGYDEE